jgi:hypothetical protein
LNYPIQGSGADIMKMSMVMLYKEFAKQGWIQGEDPKARFMLTVHDEIVFEVKHEMLMEVMPVIERIMTEPGRMKKWKVQLEVEPLIDAHWDPKYDYHKIMHGYSKPGKESPDTYTKVGDRYYQNPPPWLKGILVPDYMKDGTKPDEPSGSPPAGNPPTPPAEPPRVVAPKEEPKVEAKPEPKKESKPVETRPSSPPTNGKSVPPTNGKGNENFLVGLKSLNLTRRSIREVAGLCQQCYDPRGKILLLIDTESGEVLIGPEMKISVDPGLFGREIDRLNLGAASVQ